MLACYVTRLKGKGKQEGSGWERKGEKSFGSGGKTGENVLRAYKNTPARVNRGGENRGLAGEMRGAD